MYKLRRNFNLLNTYISPSAQRPCTVYDFSSNKALTSTCPRDKEVGHKEGWCHDEIGMNFLG